MELKMGFEVTVTLMLTSPIKSRDLVLVAGSRSRDSSISWRIVASEEGGAIHQSTGLDLRWKLQV